MQFEHGLRERQRKEFRAAFSVIGQLSRTPIEYQQLLVCIDGVSGLPIAFQCGGLLDPGILQVRSEYRGKGIGRRMVEHCVKRALEMDECLLYIQCKPSTRSSPRSTPRRRVLGTFTQLRESSSGGTELSCAIPSRRATNRSWIRVLARGVSRVRNHRHTPGCRTENSPLSAPAPWQPQHLPPCTGRFGSCPVDYVTARA